MQMTFTQWRKLVLAALLLYWPAIFTLTHVPRLPKWVAQTQLGDKTPHFLAYLGLVFLWWFAIRPYKRVNWFKGAVWVTLAAMAIYGTLDEWLQGFVQRTPDVWDFAADMTGVTAGLVLLTMFDFWLAALLVGTSVIFASVNLIQTDIVTILPMSSAVFYLVGYALIAVVWVNHLNMRYKLESGDPRWLPVALLVPLAIMAVVHGYAALVIHHIHASSIVAGLAGITAVIGTVWLSGSWRHARHSVE
jgi:VanZ family protein